MHFSFSSLNILHTCSHNWLNKIDNIPQPEKPEWGEGKDCHRIMQDHVAGIKLDKRLKHIKYTFEVVELEDFDKRCKFEFKFGKYSIQGYVDGRKTDYSQFLEGKFSSSPWSLMKFQNSMQRKIYVLSDKRYKEGILITGQRDMKLWKDDPPKVYAVPATDKDREEAKTWIQKGIDIFESGDFLQDLGNGVCTDPYCWWGQNCQFK